MSTLDLENLPRTDKGTVDFSEDFFGKEAFLTVSGQLNGETYACALSKVYTFGPRRSNTSRHLAEFWMIEPWPSRRWTTLPARKHVEVCVPWRWMNVPMT